MPRIRQYASKYAKEDILCEIREKQGRYNLMQTKALAEAVDIPYCTLRRRLLDPDDLTVAEIRKLNEVLHLDLAKVSAFMGYNTREVKQLLESEVSA